MLTGWVKFYDWYATFKKQFLKSDIWSDFNKSLWETSLFSIKARQKLVRKEMDEFYFTVVVSIINMVSCWGSCIRFGCAAFMKKFALQDIVHWSVEAVLPWCVSFTASHALDTSALCLTSTPRLWKQWTGSSLMEWETPWYLIATVLRSWSGSHAGCTSSGSILLLCSTPFGYVTVIPAVLLLGWGWLRVKTWSSAHLQTFPPLIRESTMRRQSFTSYRWCDWEGSLGFSGGYRSQSCLLFI